MEIEKQMAAPPMLDSPSLDDTDHDSRIDESVKKIPHYALPNVAAILPDYSNTEQDTIRQAFHGGSYTYLQAVPNKVDPNFVAKAKSSSVDWTKKSGYVDSGKAAWSPAKAPSRHTVFQEFEYIPSLYTLADELRSKERLQSTVAQKEIARMPFVCSDTAVRMKHEEGYAGFTRKEDQTADMKQTSTYPYQSNSYETADDLAARTRWLHTNMFMGGPMVPSGKSDFLKKPTLALLPDIVEHLQRMVLTDWPELDVQVQVTEDGFITFTFPVEELESDFGVLAYMNTRSNSNDIVEKFHLKKVLDRWNVRSSDGRAHFLFRPPWIPAPSMASTYYELHPEARTHAK